MSKYVRRGKRVKNHLKKKPSKNRAWISDLIKDSLFRFSGNFSPRFGDRTADALGILLTGLVLILLYILAPAGFIESMTGTILDSLLRSHFKI